MRELERARTREDINAKEKGRHIRSDARERRKGRRKKRAKWQRGREGEGDEMRRDEDGDEGKK